MNNLVKVLNKFKEKPNILLILGSGLNDYIKVTDIIQTIALDEVLNIKTDASIGHKGYVHLVKKDKKYLYILEGRKHYYENPSDQTMRGIIQVFAYLDVDTLIVTNAAGGMNASFKPGDIMIIDDHINMSGRNPLVGKNNHELGPRFVDMSEAYDKSYRKLMKKIAEERAIEIKHGVYVSYLGPSYETPAEIKAYKILGGDAIGMSTVPEVIVARHAGIKVLGISVITNMASGMSKEKLSHDDVLKTSQKSLVRLTDLLTHFLQHI